jgi:RNA polymerase sigma-70 factor, ECF subfamily
MNPGATVRRSNPGVDTQGETEAVLLERCRGGDTRAFQTLVEGHQDRAYTLALRIVRTPSDAEEVAQDAFVRAWRSISEFRGEAAFGTWLHRIVARRALDRAESLRARRAREEPLDPEGKDVQEHAADGETGSVGSGGSRRLERLLSALPPIQRTALAFHYFDDYSVKEIAEMLQMPEGTVKTHMSRGRAALRQAWTRAERTEPTP